MDQNFQFDRRRDKETSRNSNEDDNNQRPAGKENSAKNVSSAALDPRAASFSSPSMIQQPPMMQPPIFPGQLEMQMQMQQMSMLMQQMLMQQMHQTQMQHMKPNKHAKSSAKSAAPVKLWCPRCRSDNHALKNCTMCANDGFMDGCPKCNVLDHQYFNCPSPIGKQDRYHFLRQCRRGRPPWRMNVDHRDIRKITDGIDVSEPDEIPWTAEFAKMNIGKKLARIPDPAWHNYDNVPKQISEREGHLMPDFVLKWAWDPQKFNTPPKKPDIGLPTPAVEHQPARQELSKLQKSFLDARNDATYYTESYAAEDEDPNYVPNPNERNAFWLDPSKRALTRRWQQEQEQERTRRAMPPPPLPAPLARPAQPAQSAESNHLRFSISKASSIEKETERPTSSFVSRYQPKKRGPGSQFMTEDQLPQRRRGPSTNLWKDLQPEPEPQGRRGPSSDLWKDLQPEPEPERQGRRGPSSDLWKDLQPEPEPERQGRRGPSSDLWKDLQPEPEPERQGRRGPSSDLWKDLQPEPEPELERQGRRGPSTNLWKDQ
ncbi:hypothetical protein NHQ30_011407 [Ciborinia camelliae]|nr:hypothetical protein NHQ30_011407 [Ciborinia camelliae]